MPAIKAPAGGMTSAVNGQWYEGGQFAPDHGLSRGKGRDKVKAEVFAAFAARLAAKGYGLRYSDKHERFEVTRPDKFGGTWVVSSAKTTVALEPFAMRTHTYLGFVDAIVDGVAHLTLEDREQDRVVRIEWDAAELAAKGVGERQAFRLETTHEDGLMCYEFIKE